MPELSYQKIRDFRCAGRSERGQSWTASIMLDPPPLSHVSGNYFEVR
jgi:hypothetical protein